MSKADKRINVVANQSLRKQQGPAGDETLFGAECGKQVRAYHESFPTYEPTELVKLDNLASYLGVKSINVKDESSRFGLNAFKGLGGSHCIGKYIGRACDIPESELSYQALQSDKVQDYLRNVTFVTATDGNHGRGIAWTARELGAKAVVYMPHGSALERLENIRALGAEAEITEWNYDDTVRYAAKCQEEKGWVLVQDTSWEGYETIPTWIMQGYTTMALEAAEQLGSEKPTHVFLQAGVGAMAGALAAFFADYYGNDKPQIIIVEPDKADCIYRTAEANDGTLHIVTGALDSIMAGLSCGEPCTVAWGMLERYADFFVSMPDYVAAKGMRVLGNPLPGDKAIISGESGASTTGFVAEILENTQYKDIKQMLRLGEDSVILCISTEGDTDKANYRRIVWDGAYSNY